MASTARDGRTAAPGSRAWAPLFLAWLAALASTLGALFVGEVMGQTPCSLCWFQRAFMFPLAVVLGVASLRGDGRVWCYALPLATMGWLVAAFHVLRFVGVVPEALEPCGRGPSCTSADMTILGGLPLPLISLAAFTAIFALLVHARGRQPA